MTKQYRPLTQAQIARMTAAGCVCSDWTRVQVCEGFDAKSVHSVQFGGDVRLGVYDQPISFIAGFQGQTGIFNSAIHNCTIGDNVYISNVHTLANYDVADGCIIANITYLAVQGETCFGNGVEAVVINEGGGREVMIYDELSSHIAYIMATYRHRSKLIQKLGRLIHDYCDFVKSSHGTIGRGTKIMNCGTLKNIKIGPYAILEGVNRLENGSINSTEKANVRIGANVIAKDFILSSGTKILDNVILDKVFVGQGSELGKGYSAENTVFFANCGGFHGEACSVFAGPFTVTHHKATLLIAGMFSFFNAGSSSNQSNHMYKLGSTHQAIFERGCKMGSGAYVLYPARLGAFNVVLGKHDSHPDTRDLPFSYVLQSEMKTLIIPGYNLQSSGTLRDINKWPGRDNRADDRKNDHIIFEAITPYTVGKMLNGIEILKGLLEKTPIDAEWVDLDRCRTKRAWLEHGIEYYQVAIDDYFGQKLAQRKIAGRATQMQSDKGLGQWVDIAGLIAPKSEIDRLCDDIETGRLKDLSSLCNQLAEIYNSYEMYEWNWIADKIKDTEHSQILTRWKAAFEKNTEMILKDAAKEFNDTAMISYGIDGDEEDIKKDFQAVRGTLEHNSFVVKLREETQAKRKMAQELGL